MRVFTVKRECLLVFLALSLSVMTPVKAQAPPDAGSLRQEIEKRIEPSEPKKDEASIEPSPSPRAASAPSGPTVTVTSFRFAGNTLLGERELTKAVSGFVDRPLDFPELQKAPAAVAEAYRNAGWIVRAYLPLQEINNGVVTIEVVEALFGETRFEGSEPKRIDFDRVMTMISRQQSHGKPLQAKSLDRALLLINDLPGVAASGSLTAGKGDRETDLLLTLRDDSLFSGEVAVDNAGSRFTGENRVIGTAFVNSPFGIGDQIVGTILYAQGTRYGQLSATAPVGNNGWRVGGHVSHLSYDLIAPEFDALDAKGTSTAVGVDTTYPLIRSRTKNLYVSVSYDKSTFDNESLGATSSDYKVDTLRTNLNGYFFDELGGGGANRVTVTTTFGKVDLDGSPNQTADAATTQIDGSFTTLRYYLNRQQHLTDMVSLYGAVAGQFASGNLDSSEKFYLGGATGVRAYPTSEAGGDQGVLATLEGRVRLPNSFSAAAFYDWGQITVNRDNDFLGAPMLNSYNLQGAGLSVGWFGKFGLNIKATWAHRIGSNPRATVNGNDQDGSLKTNRFWLQASMSF